ncbi:MAG: hypothetical protein JXB88_03300 [Spirochaetales bacterium]|nr:hypothetical protein [Spirochaetales bacterium]
MPYPNEHSARLKNPDDFNKETFRRTKGGTIYSRIKVPSAIHIIWGKLKGKDDTDDPPIPQALRFPIEKWTVAQAKKWLKDHNIKYILFEPASKSSESADTYQVKNKFKKDDAEKYKKGLTDKQKEKWVKAANEALNSCILSGGSNMECEIAAIKHANALFNRNKKASDTRYLSKDNTVEVEGKRIVTKLRLTLTEAEDTDDYQMILPVGAFHATFYGEIIITPTFCEALYQNWKDMVMGNREPFIDTLHDRGKANGWIVDLAVRTDGLYARIEWTKMGEENIREGYFKYFSSDLGEVSDIDSGDPVWPVLIAVALCNTPVMNTMPKAHLSETEIEKILAHGDEDNPDNDEESEMNKEELIKLVMSLSEEEKKELVKALNISNSGKADNQTGKPENNDSKLTDQGIKNALLDTLSELSKLSEGKGKETDAELLESDLLRTKVDALVKINKQLSEKIIFIQKRDIERRKKEVIGKALAEGKIVPRDRKFWEEKFDTDPEGITEILERQPCVITYDEVGTGDSGYEPLSIPKSERQLMKQIGIDFDDLKKYGKGEETV